MGLLQLGLRIIRTFLVAANDDTIFIVCNTLVDFTLIYIGSFYLEQLCSHFWYIFIWFDCLVFPFLKGVRCQTLLVPYILTAFLTNIAIFIAQKIGTPSQILTMVKITLFEIKFVVVVAILAFPGLILIMQGPLNLMGYIGCFVFAVVLVDLAWIPGEKVQEAVIKRDNYQDWILYGAGALAIAEGSAEFYFLVNSSNYVSISLAISIPFLQLIITDKGSILTSLFISCYISYLGSTIEYHLCNYLTLCLVSIYTAAKHPNYLYIAMLLLAHSHVINVGQSGSSRMQIMITTFRVLILGVTLTYLRTLWVKRTTLAKIE